MDAICLIVAGLLRATLPAAEVTLAWDHSVQKTRWEERYRVDGGDLLLVEARVQGAGAGMEPPAGATFDRGAWTWRPNSRLAELRLTHSTYAGDYTICSENQCARLGELTGPAAEGATVTVRACTAAHEPGSASS